MVRRSLSPVLIGRARELEALERALDDVRAGLGGRSVAIGGEAGIGRSRLVAELAERARAAGVPVHRAACPPSVDGGSVPFAPFTTLLRSVVRSVDARDLDTLAGPGRAELAVLLPELGEPADRAGDEAGAARLFEAVLLLLERVAEQAGGIVLALEDLHRAERSARELFAWLVQEAVVAPILVVATARSDLPADHPFPVLLAELGRLPTTEHLELGPLTPDQADALVRAVAPPLAPETRRTIVQRAGGIPFYLEELASAPEAASGPPTSVRIAVARRLAGLDADATLVARLVAIAGTPVDLPLLAAAAGLDRERAVAAVTRATDARLVRADSTGDAAVPAHPLTAEALTAALPAGGAALLHQAWADALRRNPGLGPMAPLERTTLLARHVAATGDRDAAVPALLSAGAAASAARAFPEADAFHREALAFAGARLPALVPDAGAVLDAAAGAAWLAGDPSRAVTLGERALAALTESGGRSDDEPGLVRRLHLAAYLAAAGDHAAAAGVLDAVAGDAAPGALRARALVALARALTALGAMDQAILAGSSALALARALGDRRVRTQAGVVLGVALAAAGRDEEAMVALADARSGGPRRASGDAQPSRASRLPDALAAYVEEATLLARLGDLEGSLAVATRGRARAVDAGLGQAFGPVLAAIAAWDLARLGRWDAAADLVRSVAGDSSVAAHPRGYLGRPHADPDGGSLQVVGAWLAARQGRWDDADRSLASITGVELGSLPGADWTVVAAWAHAEAERGRGRFREARAAVRDGLWSGGSALETVPGDGREPLQRAAGTLPVELALAGVIAEADAAATARVRLDPAARDDAVRAGEELVAHARAGLARVAGPDGARAAALAPRLAAEHARLRGEPGVPTWRAAAAAADALGDVMLAAEARVGLAAALLAAGGDRGTAATRSAAAAQLDEARRLAGPLGAVPLIDAAERLARRARLAPPTPDAAADAPRGAARAIGLSEREVEVLELIAAGRSDRQIARELFITEKTAGHHVSHILTKLTVTRRGEAAAIAHRIGLTGPPGEPPAG